MSDHPHRREVLLAAREHDNGWREADAAPRLDPATGTPLDFRELPAAERIEIWRRSVRRFGSENPRVALLILRHAVEIHATYRNLTGWTAFFDELEELRRTLEEKSGIEPSAVERDYRFLEIADTLSLGACGAFVAGASRTSTVGGYRFQAALGRLALAPFPLAGATTLEVAYRVLASESFDSSASCFAELATAPWRRLKVRIQPL